MINVETIFNNKKLMSDIRISVPSVAKKYLDKDEIESEVNYIILTSMERYNPKLASIKTYLMVCIKNRFKRIILSAKKRRSTIDTVDLMSLVVYDKSIEQQAILAYLKSFNKKTLNHLENYINDDVSQMSDALINRTDKIMSSIMFLAKNNNLRFYEQSNL